MKLTASLVSLLLLCATVVSLASEYKIGVYVNGASSPSLYFGCASAESEFPAPPYSGMFGVKDVYLVSQKATPAEWYDRLSEQLLTTDGAWAIAVNSNAKLEFKVAEGSIPANAWISYNDPKKGTFLTNKLTDGTAISFKTGTLVNITVGAEPTSLVIDDDSASDERVFVTKNEDKKYVGVSNVAVSGTTITVEFVAGVAKIYYLGEPGAEANADWIFAIKGATAYSWNEDRTVLTVTLGASTRSDAEVTMTANKSSAGPVSTIIADQTIDWIIQKFGTLDFDGDGEVTNNDVMYFFNFVTYRCNPNTTADQIQPYTNAKATLERRTQALETLKNSIDDLCLSGEDKPNNNDVMFMFNFVTYKCNPNTTADQIQPYTNNKATAEIRQSALDAMKEMKD
jgi:hypothetical protein